MEALLRDQAEMLGRESPFQAATGSRLRVRIFCPRRACNRPMAEIRDLSTDVHAPSGTGQRPAERRLSAVLVIGLRRQSTVESTPATFDGAGTHWVLLEWPDVPSVIPAYCHGCSVERVLPTLRLRTALRRARRTDHEQMIHADRAPTE